MKFFGQPKSSTQYLKTSSRDLTKINNSMSQLQQSHTARITQNMQQILHFFFGKAQQNGILAKFTSDYSQDNPSQWVMERDKLLSEIQPKSRVFQRILKNKDARLIINSDCFPSYMEMGKIQRLSRWLDLKRIHQGFSVPLLDAYIIFLMKAIYNSDYNIPNYSEHQYLILDDIYSSISRNTLLVLLWRLLNYFNHKKTQLFKIVNVYQIFFMDQIIQKYQGQNFNHNISNISNNSSQNIQNRHWRGFKSKVKTHYLHALMLLIRYTQPISDNLTDLNNKYFQAVTHNFKQLSNDNHCLHVFIRIWIYYMSHKSSNNIEKQVINVIQKANSKQKWFDLKRYHPQRIQATNNVSRNNAMIAYTLVEILSIQSMWRPSTIYIYTLACFFHFLNDSHIYFTEIQNSRKRIFSSSVNTYNHNNNHNNNNQQYQSSTQSQSHKSLKKIINHFNNNLYGIINQIKNTTSPKQLTISYQLIERYQKIIQNYGIKFNRNTGTTIINNNKQTMMFNNINNNQQLQSQFKFIKIDVNLIKNQINNSNGYNGNGYQQNNNNNNQYNLISSNQAKRKLITFYRRQDRGCWQTPVQYNQSLFLYYIFFTIAKIVDILIPGWKDRKSPVLNVRFLANPMTFGSLLAVFIVLYLLLWK